MQEVEAKLLGGRVVFDGSFVVIDRSGPFTIKPAGEVNRKIPLRSLATITWKPATRLNNGFILFNLIGLAENKLAIGSMKKYMDAALKEPYAVVFKYGQMPQALELREAIERAIAGQQ